MAVREDFPRVQLTWPDATIGSPPFSMGFNFGASEDSGDMEQVADDIITFWNAQTTVLGYLTADLGPMTVVVDGIYSGVSVQYVATGGIAPTGSPVDLPGVSVRFRATGNRPVGGRRGSMFLPGLEGAGADEHGVLNGTYRSNLDSWVTSLVGVVESAVVGLTVRTLHAIGDPPTESTSVVTDFDVAPTVSFLNRRYR